MKSRRIEMRRGCVETVATVSEVSTWSNGTASITSSTIFRLDDRVVWYADHLPLCAGDEAWVAGQWRPDGVFHALAIRLPRQGVLMGGATRRGWWAGAIATVLGGVCLLAVLLATLTRGYQDAVGTPMLLLGAAMALIGSRIIRHAGKGIRACELLRADRAGLVGEPGSTTDSWAQPVGIPRG